MGYYAFYKHKSLKDVHDQMQKVEAHIGNYTFVEMESGLVAITLIYKTPFAPEELDKLGITTWPHVIEHDNPLEDKHHKGIIHPKAGIQTGDTPFAAARKLYKHLNNHAAFRPVVLF